MPMARAANNVAVAAQAAGLFDAEIAPITVKAGIADKVMGLMTKQVTVSKDEGIRDGSTPETPWPTSNQPCPGV